MNEYKPFETIITTDGIPILVSVDTCERMRLKNYRWKVRTLRYSWAWMGCTMLMHRFIMGAKTGEQVDHINGDAFDNRDENLRLCNQTQNLMNRKPRKVTAAGYKGVAWCSGKWQAAIQMNGVRYNLGRHMHQERAAKAYDRAALALAGGFAALNFENLRETYKPKMPRRFKRTRHLRKAP